MTRESGLVVVDKPGGLTSHAVVGRVRRLAGELRRLRARASVPLTDLVADTERLLLLDAETAARPGPVGRAHLAEALSYRPQADRRSRAMA